MLLGWPLEMLIGGVTYGLGRAYNKPWARVVGGGLMIVSTVWTVVSVGLVLGAVSSAQKQATGGAFSTNAAVDWNIVQKPSQFK